MDKKRNKVNKTKLGRSALIFGLAFSMAGMAAAEEASMGDNVPLVQVEVKAQKEKSDASPQKSVEPPYSRLSTPAGSQAAVQTFERKEIEAMKPRDVFDVIESAVGMGIWRQGARVHNWVKGRGGDNGAMGIIVDGVYLSSTESERVLGDLPVDMIESIKIVRDATLVTMGPLTQFGSSTGGAGNQGFILISTRKADGRETDVKTSYATYNTEKFSVFHGEKLNEHAYLGIGYAKAKNDAKTDATGNWNNAYNGDSFFLNAGYSDQKISAKMSAYVNKAWRDVQKFQEANGKWGSLLWRYDPMNTSLFSLNIDRFWSEKSTTSLSFGYTDSIGNQYRYDTPPVVPMECVDRMQEINLSHAIVSGSNTLRLGVQAMDWYQLTEGTPSTAAEERSFGYYLFDEKKLSEKLSIDGAFRLERKYLVTGGKKYVFSGSQAGVLGGRWENNATNFSFGSAYQLSPLYKASGRISYSKTPTDIRVTTLYDAALPDEKRWKYEAGITANYSKAFNATLTAFYYDITDGIVQATKPNGSAWTVPAKDGTGNITIYTSAPHLTRKGLELAFNGSLSDTFGYDVSYSWFTSSNANEDVTNPHNKYTIRLNYKKADYDASLSLVHVCPYVNNNAPVGNFTVVNASLGKAINANTKVTLFAQNLTNQKYATMYKGVGTGYFYDVGRVIGLEISRKF